ncbi:MAG: AmmeMemoRadiSam system radical SAM enzyme, partial [Planctomycetes bacterium]|nr:AmmeMemoRadiSam system radical SAM enzyme [Planctomycetota bacterium]
MPSVLRQVDLPPADGILPDGSRLGGWWHELEGSNRIVCDLCPRDCHLKPGDRGFCFVRENRDGQMVLNTYGRSTGFCIDPIEKKPLNHFYPGTSVLSFGTAGCNLGCKFCQNHDISKAREVALLSEQATPETIARAAQELGCRSVAFTYNDPVIWAEYAIDTAKACRAVGVKSVAVTAGYITPRARGAFYEHMDAANVDLKAFTEKFYYQLTLSHLQPVLDTLEWLKKETDVWFEITNLVIPDANDTDDEFRQMCDWVLEHIGDDTPVHFSAFHPDFKMMDRPHTPVETLLRAYETAKRQGLKFVYVGNVHNETHQSTYCPHCDKLLIQRDWYELGAYQLKGDRCGHCGGQVPGRFDERPGNWGRRRAPVSIARHSPPIGITPPARTSSSPSKQRGPAMTTTEQATISVLEQAPTL